MNTLTTELMHYGVMGMHWGIRRYQPYPAAYDGDGKFIGKKAFKEQFRKDKAHVDQLTKDASIAGAGLTASRARLEKYGKKLVKALNKEGTVRRRDGNNSGTYTLAYDHAELSKKAQDLDRKFKAAKRTYNAFVGEHAALSDQLHETVNSLKKKYGDKNVRDVVYKSDKYGNMVVTEPVNEGLDWLATAATAGLMGGMLAATGGSGLGLAAIGSSALPLMAVLHPRSRKSQGRFAENIRYDVAKEMVDDEYKQYLKDVAGSKGMSDADYEKLFKSLPESAKR
jgi:hypothetical protein